MAASFREEPGLRDGGCFENKSIVSGRQETAMIAAFCGLPEIA
ncbi:hypothetical protein [Geothermobacter hydrogeniphilus]|nr:hypothetical protein [Geothermobacter hydrogeniphilus]